MMQESIGVVIHHNSIIIPTNSLLVMYVPTSGGIFAGRSPVSFQFHTKQNSPKERIAVVIRNRYPANFHHWLPLYVYALRWKDIVLDGEQYRVSTVMQKTTTQIYAKIVDSKKVEAVNLVDNIFD